MTPAEAPGPAPGPTPLEAPRRDWLPAAFLAPAALVLVLFMAVPMVNAVLLSFQSWNGMSEAGWVGLANHRALLSHRIFLIALGDTATFTAATVVLRTVLPPWWRAS